MVEIIEIIMYKSFRCISQLEFIFMYVSKRVFSDFGM